MRQAIRGPRHVRKRDGRIQDYDEAKVARGVERAMLEIGRTDGPVSRAVATSVTATLRDVFDGHLPSVDDVADAVENALLDRGLGDVAKAFILYRAMKARRGTPRERFGVKDDLSLGVNAIKVLERRYLKKDAARRVIEAPSELFRRVARAVASVEQAHGASRPEIAAVEQDFHAAMAACEFLPNSPTLMNAGLPRGQLSACFVLPVEDSLPGIFDSLKTAARVHQTGGGTGFSFSALRPDGDLVRSTGGQASGPLSFIRLFDLATEVIKQGGRRRGANMAILDVHHPDVAAFVAAKADGVSFPNFNFSVGADDAFMRAVSRGGKIALTNPRTGKQVGAVDARKLFGTICEEAWRTGDPGMVWFDEVDRKNPTRHEGRIEATNPCGEQPLHPFESCTLGSINLGTLVGGDGRFDWKRLDRLVALGVRFLDDALDATVSPTEEIARATLRNRRIGLGVMGFADALILLGIPYDSPKALVFARRLMKAVRDAAWKTSAALGRERGSFPAFRGSLWQKRGWRAFRNATTTTIAPTGTISIVAGASSGIEPLFAVAFVRNVMEGTRLLDVNPLFERLAKKRGFWSSELAFAIAERGTLAGAKSVPADVKRLFRTALEIRPAAHVRMQAAFQAYTDNAVSKTINLPERATKRTVADAFLLAWKLKCKGITVYRYGSKADQVLTLGALDAIGKERQMTAESEFSGDCRGGVCTY